LIQGGTHAQQLLEDIAFECYRVGALPLITAASDDFSRRVMEKIPSKTLEQTPRHLLGAIEKMDCQIAIERYEDPSIINRFAVEKVQSRAKAQVPIRKVVYGEDGGGGRKWCYAGWPTEKGARFFGVDYELYERFIIDGMTVPKASLRKRCERIQRLLQGAVSVHISDPEGTDLSLTVKGRRWNLDDGFVSDEDVAAGDKGNNLPAGEVFIAPHETEGSGNLFCPVTMDPYTGKRVTDVELSVEGGRLDLKKVRAGENRDALVASFKRAMKIDEGSQEEVRTLNVAELGIGTNPKITKAIGYILTDEKIIGSAHVAFGSNYSYGGTSKSAIHWDFVTVPEVTIVARMEDGSETTVMKNGKVRRRGS